jgi:hypothetical protein
MNDNTITYVMYADPFTKYEVHTIAEIATIIIAEELCDIEIAIMENDLRTGVGYYDSDGEQITPRIYHNEEQPDLHFPEEYWSAEGLCKQINEELTKQLAA